MLRISRRAAESLKLYALWSFALLGRITLSPFFRFQDLAPCACALRLRAGAEILEGDVWRALKSVTAVVGR